MRVFEWMRRCLGALVLISFAWGCDRPPIHRDVGYGSKPDTGAPDVSADVPELEPYAEGCQAVPFVTAQTFETHEDIAPILNSLTLSQKVSQMAGLLPGLNIFETPDDNDANIRGFRFRDGPRGVANPADEDPATCFPVSVARGATWDLDLERRIAEAMGKEIRGLGHNLLLAPCINTLRHPGWGRAQETYGEDPWFLGKMGVAFVQGVQSQVPGCVKHFAGNNIEDTRHTNNAVMDEQTLRENYTRQFKMVVEESDVACVMSAYNKLNGEYCSENHHLLREILKDQWKFDGFVVSDWFAAKTTVASALAGLDVEMPFMSYYGELEAAVSAGDVSEALINEAVTRILRIKFKWGFANLNQSFSGDPEVVESPEHIALAREAAQKSMVLLKNEESLLPLDRNSGQKIAVVGHWATHARLGDAGSSNVHPSYAITPFDGIKSAAGEGVEVVTSADASAAEGADVAIVVAALIQSDEGEALLSGGDRDDLELRSKHIALIKEVAQMADKTIVIMEAGGPITMEGWREDADSIIMAWYPGMEGGTAMGDLIFGDVNFSGRTIQTWPKAESDLPEFGNTQAETEYLYYHGYRHFDHHEIEPLFPFGFGLSYTTFEYENLQVPCARISPEGHMTITVDVRNTGDRKGVEVVQVYVAYPNTKVRRPERELKGFTRVELAAGENQSVNITIPIRDLAYYDTESKKWVVEELEHRVEVGPNARTLPLSASFEVGGGLE